MNYQCPRCGYYTLAAKPNGNGEKCHVCFWEDVPPVKPKDNGEKALAEETSEETP